MYGGQTLPPHGQAGWSAPSGAGLQAAWDGGPVPTCQQTPPAGVQALESAVDRHRRIMDVASSSSGVAKGKPCPGICVQGVMAMAIRGVIARCLEYCPLIIYLMQVLCKRFREITVLDIHYVENFANTWDIKFNPAKR